MTSIARVFPRKTKATPTDNLCFFDEPPSMFPPHLDEIHISCTFSYDLPKAERLAKQWGKYYPNKVKMGGPATGMAGSDFIPGRYLREGYTITSRGCPNRCWFCSVPQREGETVRELKIQPGWNVLDDNILACSENHIRAVFAMLQGQKKKAQFTGGLEAARLRDWHIDLLVKLKPAQIFFAYDTPDDYEPLVLASRKLRDAGFDRHKLRCYCLIGYPKDTIEKAEIRLVDVLNLGFFPAAMLFRNIDGITTKEWKQFQREWSRPAIIYAKYRSC